jgi:hypothetical protein
MVLMRVIIYTALLLLPSLYCYAADWKYYAIDNSDNVYFYDEESIVHLQNNTVQVWTKCVYSEKFKEILRTGTVEWPELSKTQAEKYAKYKLQSYVVDLSEINCATRTIQGLMERQYDDNGSLLDTIDKETLSKIAKHTGEGSYIAPESIDEVLYNIVCKKVRQDPKQKKGKSSLNKD